MNEWMTGSNLEVEIFANRPGIDVVGSAEIMNNFLSQYAANTVYVPSVSVNSSAFKKEFNNFAASASNP